MSHEADLNKRLETEELQRQAGYFRGELLNMLLGAVTSSIVILNACRQIVYANSAILALLETESVDDILGLRPGEVFECAHALEGLGGCGTSMYCRQCGAMRAIVNGLDGIENDDECRIISRRGMHIEAYDLHVRATPFNNEGEDFVIIAFSDVSHEKRRRALERIFFHDILNTAGGLRGFVEVLMAEAPESMRQDTALLHRFLSMLVEEIKAHKLLLAAESEELRVKVQPLSSMLLLESVFTFFSGHDAASRKELRIAEDSQDVAFESDGTLLRRVLVNLVKNALEASQSGERVTMKSHGQGLDSVVFEVHNPSVIPRDIQLQIFNRSFSTKGEGRGLGTYSVKLLSERYLGGQVSFSSDEEQGTRFVVTLPRRFEPV